MLYPQAVTATFHGVTNSSKDDVLLPADDDEEAIVVDMILLLQIVSWNEIILRKIQRIILQ